MQQLSSWFSNLSGAINPPSFSSSQRLNLQNPPFYNSKCNSQNVHHWSGPATFFQASSVCLQWDVASFLRKLYHQNLRDLENKIQCTKRWLCILKSKKSISGFLTNHKLKDSLVDLCFSYAFRKQHSPLRTNILFTRYILQHKTLVNNMKFMLLIGFGHSKKFLKDTNLYHHLLLHKKLSSQVLAY